METKLPNFDALEKNLVYILSNPRSNFDPVEICRPCLDFIGRLFQFLMETGQPGIEMTNIAPDELIKKCIERVAVGWSAEVTLLLGSYSLYSYVLRDALTISNKSKRNLIQIPVWEENTSLSNDLNRSLDAEWLFAWTLINNVHSNEGTDLNGCLHTILDLVKGDEGIITKFFKCNIELRSLSQDNHATVAVSFPKANFVDKIEHISTSIFYLEHFLIGIFEILKDLWLRARKSDQLSPEDIDQTLRTFFKMQNKLFQEEYLSDSKLNTTDMRATFIQSWEKNKSDMLEDRKRIDQGFKNSEGYGPGHRTETGRSEIPIDIQQRIKTLHIDLDIIYCEILNARKGKFNTAMGEDLDMLKKMAKEQDFKYLTIQHVDFPFSNWMSEKQRGKKKILRRIVYNYFGQKYTLDSIEKLIILPDLP